jgi:hypothetical protein
MNLSFSINATDIATTTASLRCRRTMLSLRGVRRCESTLYPFLWFTFFHSYDIIMYYIILYYILNYYIIYMRINLLYWLYFSYSNK